MTAMADPKIIDLIRAEEEKDGWTSLEFFPPKSAEGVKNLTKRMERMKVTKPLFTDVTWGAGGSTADLSTTIAKTMRDVGYVANLHMTCTNMGDDIDPITAIKNALDEAKDAGIRNIVALRGDPPHGQDEWTAAEGGFTCALDLVKFMRKNYGDEFGISVAGYPEGHPKAITQLTEEEANNMTAAEKGRCSMRDGVTYVCKDEDYEKELIYLKEKVDAGSDFIMTQMFFDTAVYGTFVKDCRARGITCPIVPGLMCINAYRGFMNMTKFCRTRVPESLLAKMEEIKDDVDAVKAFGVSFGIQMCKDILSYNDTKGLHFYTLNLEKVVYGILDGLGITNSASKKTDESDAKSMQAVGSAWARVGDNIKTSYGGLGTVTDIREDGTTVVLLDKWDLANGQRPTLYLRPNAYTKVMAA
eukprot:CAMPEP_0113311638 /NCGR_PEP_ID=MMETSP0010_2-20120614/8791_1 /TAXON_ID=216773 ORGANISM="Corethron hystrix, Strain 308" /NCGR_SAMPLE_ID=MMETSP0010_2 /ASSEMBLY_ACC=CAM_ASM_000155 /LENGTH=414 /DNA_ID=CAMNT_0000167309 /DNA_START=141 /DNA_END=1385 /DNA_ORIENTATION=- /assembly_acc=CAM_ASM_000155